MSPLDRRQALRWTTALGAFGAPAAATAGLEPPYPETAGEEVAPGVREVFLGRQDTSLATYGTVWLTDLVFRPGASRPADLLANDMLALRQHGLVRVRLDAQELMLCEDTPLWAFPKGAMLAWRNPGADAAVVRVLDLLPGLHPRASAAP